MRTFMINEITFNQLVIEREYLNIFPEVNMTQNITGCTRSRPHEWVTQDTMQQVHTDISKKTHLSIFLEPYSSDKMSISCK